MDINELEAKVPVVTGVVADDTDDDQMLVDLQDAIHLLTKCKTLLDYVSDPDLTKGITNRERDSMTRLAQQMRDYLGEVEATYGEVE